MRHRGQNQVISKIWHLVSYQGDKVIALVILPIESDGKNVSAAWSYALTHTAKGLEHPDHDKALQLLKQRHPSWILEKPYPLGNVGYNRQVSENDVPDMGA